MLKAQLHGKLSLQQENMEDILTSNVFGALSYSLDKGLLPRFLGLAQSLAGRRLHDATDRAESIELDFWPSLNLGADSVEPDLLAKVTHDDGRRSWIVIEAKYHSGKSTESTEDEDPDRPGDQLVRQWLALERLYPSEPRHLVFVTADFALPKQDLEDTQRVLASCGDSLYWLSWRAVAPLVRDATEPVLRDLRLLLERQELTYYAGLPSITSSSLGWTFGPTPSDRTTSEPIFQWLEGAGRNPWQFLPSADSPFAGECLPVGWKWPTRALEWRYP